MLRNAVNQTICAQLINKVTGDPVTVGPTTIRITGDHGVQFDGTGAIIHEGNGEWSYVPVLAETNFAHIAFTFLNPVALNATKQLYTTPEGLGSGPYSITITVRTNLGIPIQGAQVALYKSDDYRFGTTDINGQVIFYSEPAVWTTVAIITNNYQFTTGTITVVDANISVIYDGVLIPAPVPGAGQVNLVAPVYDEYGVPENGVRVYAQMVKAPLDSGIFDSAIMEFTSVAGSVTIANVFKTAKYQIWRGRIESSNRMVYTVPDTTEAVIDLPAFIGNDSTDPCLVI